MEFNESLGNLLDDIDLGPDAGIIVPTKIDPNAKRTRVEELACQENEFAEGIELYTCYD